MFTQRSALIVFFLTIFILLFFAVVYQVRLIHVPSAITAEKPLYTMRPTPYVELPSASTRLSVEQSIGQILMTSLTGLSLTDQEREAIQRGTLSNMLLLSKNIKDEKQLKKLIDSIYREATVSGNIPLIAIDQEGGPVSRIPWIEKTAQIRITDEEHAYQVALVRGRQLRDLGITMNFSPVIEFSNEQDSFIAKQKRGFASNSALLSQTMIRGYKEAGIIPVAKHFPAGLGRTHQDPHVILPILSDNRQDLIMDVLAFGELGVDAIMVTHLLYPAVDASPSSASRILLHQMLRNDMGFDGLIISDDLSMGAIKDNYQIGEYAKTSLISGVDLLIINSMKDYKDVFEALQTTSINSRTFQLLLDQHVSRILSAKRTLKISNN